LLFENRCSPIIWKCSAKIGVEYNDWIKEYADKKELPLLDLEKALRTKDSNRFLRDELTKGDGLHLNEDAYRLLDDTLIRTLARAFPRGTDKPDRRQGARE
jgi:lysophospholipase L1-like esterase